ncbi:unnamed protein product [Lactuca virosa]|uniref:Uncharacterized protein n=1 Tax=Lactuca virosa TaxID=75947 RepID=A0AAU9MZL9_9ASTR|nr:unnamed protein product [Lactuca virosa]
MNTLKRKHQNSVANDDVRRETTKIVDQPDISPDAFSGISLRHEPINRSSFCLRSPASGNPVDRCRQLHRCSDLSLHQLISSDLNSKSRHRRWSSFSGLPLQAASLDAFKKKKGKKIVA